MSARKLEPEPEPARFRPATGIIPILLLGCIGCILLGIRSFRQDAEPLPPTPAAPTNAPLPAIVVPATPPTTSAPTRETLALNGAHEAFARYRDMVLAGDFAAASNAFRTIDTRLPTDALHAQFWNEALPVDHRAQLTLAQLCLLCVEGQCWRCRGAGTCSTCLGSGTCQTCKGNSARMVRCTACLCATCGGNARCRACRGHALVLCAACGGSGSSAVAERVTCPACRGSGTRSGLQRGDRESTPLRCLTCRGAGTRESSRFGTCPSCEGRGRVACSACNGNGRCTTCAGQGHRTPCPTCNSTGQVRLECKACNGSGQCNHCAGTTQCTTCGGAKACPKCGGGGLIRLMSLTVDKAWLTQVQGYVVVDGKTGEELGASPYAGAQEFTVRERTLSFTNAPDELIWISTDGSTRQVRKLMMP